MNVYVVEGSAIQDMDSLGSAFAAAVSAPDGYFGRDFQSFDDCLFGGFGMECPCEIVWKNHATSKQHLNAKLLADYCEQVLTDEKMHTPAYAEGKKWAVDTLVMANDGKRTMFDEIVDAIQTTGERSCGRRNITLTLQ